MLARVQRLEQAKTPAPSPFERAYGSVEAFEAEVRAAMDAGALDCRDGCTVLQAVRTWHDHRFWDVGN